MRSYEKGAEGADIALELDDEVIRQVTDDDVNIIDNIQIEDTPNVVDNEDEIDEITDRLSDIDHDELDDDK